MMAIVMCAHCDSLVDDDYFPCSEYKGELICDSCADDCICATCECEVEMGDLNEDGECANCEEKGNE